MKEVFKDVISTEAELRDLIGEPSEMVKRKVISIIDKHVSDYVKESPFLILSTANSEGECDASPRGDAPGFVQILNEKQLLIPERPGNKRIDSMLNILSNPHVGVLFLIPGLGETLRINGRARIIADQDQLNKASVNGKVPTVGIVIDVEECFIHCAKSIIRSHLWEPKSWSAELHVAPAAKIVKEHANMEDLSEKNVEQRLKESYTKRLY